MEDRGFSVSINKKELKKANALDEKVEKMYENHRHEMMLRQPYFADKFDANVEWKDTIKAIFRICCKEFSQK